MLTSSDLLLDAIDKKLVGEVLRSISARDRAVPAIFLLCTHEWGNIGDLAINFNEVAMLERLFPHLSIFAISRSTLAANWQRFRAMITPDDVLVIHGGGNMGDLWPHEEEARLAVVETFPHNRIVSMPQSIHFENQDNLRRSMRVYRRHARLLLAVRDDRSAAVAQTHLADGVVFRTEDAVLRQEYPFSLARPKQDVLIVERDDKEKNPLNRIDALRTALLARGQRLRTTDTTVPRLPFSNTELAAKLVYGKIDEIHSANVVITDRLHGAIFALIAGRPLVVFENSYRKIEVALKNVLPAMGPRVYFADSGDDDTVLSRTLEMSTMPATTLLPSTILADAHRQFESDIERFLCL